MEDVELECVPARFRRMFATIIFFNIPSNVPELGMKYGDILGEGVGQDLRRYDIHCDSELIVQIVVILIEVKLNEMDIEIYDTRLS